MKRTYNTYKKSGVNMAAANKLVDYISKISRKTYKKNTKIKSFNNIGSFGSVFDLSRLKMKNPLIVASTDGVGTKIELANQTFQKPADCDECCSILGLNLHEIKWQKDPVWVRASFVLKIEF